VISEGLKAEEWVVIGGLQQIRPRMQIKTERTPMPSYGASEGGVSAGTAGSAGKPPPTGTGSGRAKQ
jgi:multidrug efflux system membrane fusion protein